MRIISEKALTDFVAVHSDAKEPMQKFKTTMRTATFNNFAEVKKTFGSADPAAPFVIFNVGGNNYRVIGVLRYKVNKIFIRYVLTHEQYNEWCKKYRKGELIEQKEKWV